MKRSLLIAVLFLAQVQKCDQIGEHGHLYGTVIASVGDFISEKGKGKYGEYHLAFCAHYVTDLSQPFITRSGIPSTRVIMKRRTGP